MNKRVIRVMLSPGQAEKFADFLYVINHAKIQRHDEDGICVDFYPPKNHEDHDKWINEHARHLSDCGFLVAIAPEYNFET